VLGLVSNVGRISRRSLIEALHSRWASLIPLAALAFAGTLILTEVTPSSPWLAVPTIALLLGAVFGAVHHAETIALHLGDPLGAIVLAIAVTIIEIALILGVVLHAPPGVVTIARDTVFAAIMITLNGIVGLSLLVGGLRHYEQEFRARGATAALGVLGTVAVLALVLPDFNDSVPGPVYAAPQLLFVAAVSLLLYGLFLFVQMVRHRDDFRDSVAAGAHRAPPNRRQYLTALFFLPVALLGVILSAELLAPLVEVAIMRAGLPVALVGVAIAVIVLMPEGMAAVRAAISNRLQTSLNLALGSALASICLTIPCVALLTLFLDKPLALGLAADHVVLLVLSLFMATLTLAMGRTTVLQGAIHLVIFGTFLAISMMP